MNNMEFKSQLHIYYTRLKSPHYLQLTDKNIFLCSIFSIKFYFFMCRANACEWSKRKRWIVLNASESISNVHQMWEKDGKRTFQSSRHVATREARRGSMIGSFRSRWTDGEEKAVNGPPGIYFYFSSSRGQMMLQMNIKAHSCKMWSGAWLAYFDWGAKSNRPTV